MRNPKLSEDTQEKIATVFQNYAVNPVAAHLEAVLKSLENRLVDPEDDECLENALLGQADKIAGSISSMRRMVSEQNDELRDTLTVCEGVMVGTNNAVETMGNKQNELQEELRALAPQIVQSADNVLEQLHQVHADGRKVLEVGVADIKDSVNTLEEHLNERIDSEEKKILTSLSAEKNDLLEKLEKVNIGLADRGNQLQTTIVVSLNDHYGAISKELKELKIEEKAKLVVEQTQQACKDGRQALRDSTEDVKSFVNTINGKLDEQIRAGEKRVLEYINAEKKVLLERVEASTTAAAAQSGQIETVLQGELQDCCSKTSEEMKQLSAIQTEEHEQIKAELLRIISIETAKLEKMLRIAWAIGGASLFSTLAALTMLLIR